MLSDYNNPIDSGMTSGDPGLDGESISYLRSCGKWGKFIAIFGMAIIGIMAVMMVVGGGAGMFGMMMGGGDLGMGGGLMTFMLVFYGAVFAFAFYIYFLLYQFSTNALRATERDDSTAMRSAFKSLATIFKIIGVITAIYVGFMALGVVMALFGGLAAAF